MYVKKRSQNKMNKTISITQSQYSLFMRYTKIKNTIYITLVIKPLTNPKPILDYLLKSIFLSKEQSDYLS